MSSMSTIFTCYSCSFVFQYCSVCGKKFDSSNEYQEEDHDCKMCLTYCPHCGDVIDQKPNILELNGSLEPYSLRIATWNIQDFSLRKASRKSIKNAFCQVIYDNDIDLIAIQELKNMGNGLHELVDKLNERKGVNWDFVISESPSGRLFGGMEYPALVWNSAASGIEINFVDSFLYKKFTRSPFFVTLQVNKKLLTFISLHLKAVSGRKAAATKAEIRDLPSILPNDEEVIVLGDFNMNSHDAAFNKLKENLSMLAPLGIETCGTNSYDQIWVNHSLISEDKSYFGVVENDSVRIVSNHNLVWADIQIETPVEETKNVRHVVKQENPHCST